MCSQAPSTGTTHLVKRQRLWAGTLVTLDTFWQIWSAESVSTLALMVKVPNRVLSTTSSSSPAWEGEVEGEGERENSGKSYVL